jgi:hypothetical protein
VLRLGVILSVVWLLGFAGLAWFSSMRELRNQYSHYLGYCSAILEKDPNQTGRYGYCLSDANELYLRTVDEYKNEIPWLLTIDFGTLAAGWTVALVGIGTVRCVKWMLSRRQRQHRPEDQFFFTEM